MSSLGGIDAQVGVMNGNRSWENIRLFVVIVL
jgi:hypothetical protein